MIVGCHAKEELLGRKFGSRIDRQIQWELVASGRILEGIFLRQLCSSGRLDFIGRQTRVRGGGVSQVKPQDRHKAIRGEYAEEKALPALQVVDELAAHGAMHLVAAAGEIEYLHRTSRCSEDDANKSPPQPTSSTKKLIYPITEMGGITITAVLRSSAPDPLRNADQPGSFHQESAGGRTAVNCVPAACLRAVIVKRALAWTACSAPHWGAEQETPTETEVISSSKK